MKYIFSFLATMLIGLNSSAQQGIVGQYLRLSPSSLPAVCRNGDIRFDSGSTQLEFCSSNSWSAFSSVPGGGTGTTGFQQYSLVIGGATSLTSLGTGTSSQFLQSQGAGANPIWYSLFPVSVANGGTGATTLSGLRTSIGAAASGANSDITSITGLSTPLAVSQGGIGAATETAHSVLIGQGTAAVTNTGVGTSGQVLTSNGTGNDPTWISLGGSGTVTSVAAGVGLTTGSSSAITSSGSLSLIAPVTVVNGGTGQTNAYNSFGPLYAASGGLSITSSGVGTSGQFYSSNGTGNDPTWKSYVAPTMTVLSGTGSLTGTIFTVSSANATIGSTYTNNGTTYTILSTVSTSTVLYALGNATTSGTTLTRASGTGDSTITFSTKISTATYTAPSDKAALYLKVTIVGGGGGGGGSATSGNGGIGGSGGTTVFGAGLLTAGGGTGGDTPNHGGTGVGGGATLGPGISGVHLSGGDGNPATYDGGSGTNLISVASGNGGSSFFGGAGAGISGSTSSGNAGKASTGGGGGGAAISQATSQIPASGGGAGGYAFGIIPGPTAAQTYQYVVGTAGTGGTLGTGGAAGGAGGAGLIIIEEYYQ